MVLEELSLTLGVLLVLVFAQYAGVLKKATKQFSIVAAGAASLLIAEVTGGVTVLGTYLSSNATYIVQLFEAIGWILVLIGGIWAIVVLASSK